MEMQDAVKNLTFNVLQGDKIPDVITYVKNYIKLNPDVEIHIGTDSQNKGALTTYGLVICLYNPGKGGHVLYAKEAIKRNNDMWVKIWREVELSLSIAEWFRLNGLKYKVKYIDLDINPDPRWGSNSVLRAALGYVTAMGYVPRNKPDAFSASYIADKLCRGRKSLRTNRHKKKAA